MTHHAVTVYHNCLVLIQIQKEVHLVITLLLLIKVEPGISHTLFFIFTSLFCFAVRCLDKGLPSFLKILAEE